MSRKRQNEDQAKEIKRKKLLSEVARGKLQFLMPDHPDFRSLMREKYFNFAHERSSCIPASLQAELPRALDVLHHHGYFYRDWVKVKGETVQTPVSRTLIGEPETTYKYLGLRLFAIPWCSWDRQQANEVELACGSIEKLNEHVKVVSRKLLHRSTAAKTRPKCGSSEDVAQGPAPQSSTEKTPCSSQEHKPLACGPTVEEGTNFNVVLINYMDPKDPDLRLKAEPYYGMGPLAVSWHMDSNLVPGSTVAVYNHTRLSDEDRSTDSSDWMVGLKVSWDIETPGVAIPLQTGESYFMLGDLNDTHQHCVVAGGQARFSTTHRVADCSQGTLSYIQCRCKGALSNLDKMQNGEYRLKSLNVDHLELTETVHNEVEFEWLRQFWMQGSRHAEERKSWIPAMEDLEANWHKMEHMTKLAVQEVNGLDTEDGSKITLVLLPHLKDRQRLRQDCLEKFSPKILATMHPDFLPIHRPKWEDDDPLQPLPFDLNNIIRKMILASKCWETSCTSDSESSDSDFQS